MCHRVPTRKDPLVSDRSEQDTTVVDAYELRDGPSLLPPRAAIAELVVLLAIIVAVSWLFPQVDVTQLQPNPFWLPVLVLSLQYGTVSGLLAAISVIAISLLGYPLPEQESDENLFAYAARAFAQPVLWIAAAVLLGQFRVRQIEAKRNLARAVDILARQRAALASYARGLRERCDTLERDIVGRSSPPALAALAALDALEAETTASAEPGTALGRAIPAVFPGASAAIVARAAGRPIVVASHGAPAAVTAPEAALATLAAAVIDERRAIDILSREGEAALAGLGTAAVPIVRTGNGGEPAAIGALVVDGLTPGEIGPETVPALRVVSRLLAPAVARGLALSPVAASPQPAQAAAASIAAVAVAGPPRSRPDRAEATSDRAIAGRHWSTLKWLSWRTGRGGGTERSAKAGRAASGGREQTGDPTAVKS